ncbi:cell division inhibitor SepF [Halobacillus karajensis]|uniref:Cell division protein SepF n=1 Tax=Halobacillus karajensis TaxID=195088 RepID=A0A024P3T2_9BACI|nr:cell division protein SepF [Halobacillus karajensis]CDQ19827.1 Cell division protein SepF [Halobacillus karajensis]CDQ22287.1 Cell division protein SepF [Halobacillus karajensis]CDQ28128.1 Cell division protein SepF [Halobacillus karajensis]SEH71505.1 cell division inhibitor SepF [Halobacillus karajensis]
MSMKNKFRSFFTLDDEYEYIEEEVEDELEEEPAQRQRSTKRQDQGNVVSLKSAKSSSKMVLSEPSSYNEAQNIADQLVSRRAVVINLQRVDHHQAKRIVDFLSGTVYAIGGDIQKLGTQTFLCTPDNVEISGSISEMMAQEDDDMNRRW